MSIVPPWPTLAYADTVTLPWHPTTFGEAVVSTAVFGALGMALMLLGFKLFEWVTPRLDVEKELAEKNLSVAIVVTAMLLALGYIIARTIAG